jgi:proline-specific peptidase
MDRLTTADRRVLAYRRTGSGQGLVCHGGGPGFSASYLGDLAGLTAHLELVLLDPRGTGGSDRPADPRAYGITDYVADLEELRAHLAIERMRLLGHSHGGMVAMAYAARYPEHIDRLILVSTFARFSPEQEAAMAESVEKRAGEPWYADARAALEAEEAGDFDTDEELSELALREFPFYFAHYGDLERAYVDSLGSEKANADPLRLFNTEIIPALDLRPELSRIAAPTLVITGERDFITGPPSAVEIAGGIPGAELVVLPDTGHFIFVEAPEAFRAAVLSFLPVAAPA